MIGSSGGGAATLGHTDPLTLLTSIEIELGRCRAFVQHHSSTSKNEEEEDDDWNAHVPATAPKIRHALYVSLHSGVGLDHATDDSPATLYAVGCGHDDDNNKNNADSTSSSPKVRIVCTGPLHEINNQVRHLDTTYIARSIRYSKTDGLISISSDPSGVNSSSIRAASQRQIPVTGSGGTSLSIAAAECGVNLVGNAGGSVATTTYTRAVSYVCALVDAWSERAVAEEAADDEDATAEVVWKYSPFVPSRIHGNGCADGMQKVQPHLRSVLDSCVPAFVAVCVTCRALELLAHWLEVHSSLVDIKEGHSEPQARQDAYQVYPSLSLDIDTVVKVEGLIARLYWQLQFHALPTVCAVISGTTYAPEMGSVVLMASGVASVGCGGSVLAGLLAGCAVACLSKRALFACIKLNVPATMTNVLVAGGVGCAVALGLSMTGIVGGLAEFGNLLRTLVRLTFLIPSPPGATPLPGLGFLLGVVFCYGSKVGWYHSVFLPIILIEMERGEGSILGAVDECTLCLVSAGICLGNIVTAPLMISSDSTSSDIAISKRGLKINLLCGDFIEAAYPFMERSYVVNVFAYLASGISTELLLHHRPEHVLSSAYIPVGLSIVLAQDMKRMTLACTAAFIISFVGSVLGNIAGRRLDNNKDKKE